MSFRSTLDFGICLENSSLILWRCVVWARCTERFHFVSCFRVLIWLLGVKEHALWCQPLHVWRLFLQHAIFSTLAHVLWAHENVFPLVSNSGTHMHTSVHAHISISPWSKAIHCLYLLEAGYSVRCWETDVKSPERMWIFLLLLSVLSGFASFSALCFPYSTHTESCIISLLDRSLHHYWVPPYRPGHFLSSEVLIL